MDLKKALNRLYDEVQFSNSDSMDALNAWERTIRTILDDVHKNDARFKFSTMHYTGSFYERAKIGQPDEFDLMLELSNIIVSTPGRAAAPGFTFLIVEGQQSKRQWARDSIVDGHGRLNAVNMRAVFSRLVSDAIKKVDGSGITKETHGPAVTLHINTGSGTSLDVDLTLAIKLTSWPPVTTQWKERSRRGWPNADLIHAMESIGCYVVAKQPGDYTGDDKQFMWRFSFSLSEKIIMTRMDRGNANSCRRKVLQMLKCIISNDPQLRNVPLRSYHMKTLIFWESEKFPNAEEWDASLQVATRFLSAVDRLLTYTRNKSFPHYFLRGNFNLFSGFKEQHFATISDTFGKIKSDPVPYILRLICRLEDDLLGLAGL